MKDCVEAYFANGLVNYLVFDKIAKNQYLSLQELVGTDDKLL